MTRRVSARAWYPSHTDWFLSQFGPNPMPPMPSSEAIRKADRAQALSARGLCDCHEKPFNEDGKCAQEAE